MKSFWSTQTKVRKIKSFKIELLLLCLFSNWFRHFLIQYFLLFIFTRRVMWVKDIRDQQSTSLLSYRYIRELYYCKTHRHCPHSINVHCSLQDNRQDKFMQIANLYLRLIGVASPSCGPGWWRGAWRRWGTHSGAPRSCSACTAPARISTPFTSALDYWARR